MSSNIYAKPLPNKSADLRIQRLRLTTVGSASSKLKNENDQISYKGRNPDLNYDNYTNRVLSRVRAGGSVSPKKKIMDISILVVHINNLFIK